MNFTIDIIFDIPINNSTGSGEDYFTPEEYEDPVDEGEARLGQHKEEEEASEIFYDVKQSPKVPTYSFSPLNYRSCRKMHFVFMG